jgi:hypothetical protein
MNQNPSTPIEYGYRTELPKPDHISQPHWQEWLDSSVDPEIIKLNVRSLFGDEAYRYLIPDPTAATGRSHPDAQWRWIRKRYPHIENGGWWCKTIDPTTLEKSLWGTFKPDTPRPDFSKPGKIIKYEHPPKTPTEVFCLDVPLHIWERIAARYGLVVTPGNKDVNTDGVTTSYGIEFWEWVLANPQIPIIPAEGVKKAGAILSAGYVAVALPGITSGYRTPKDDRGRVTGMRFLIDQLKVFAVDDRLINFAFDQDEKYKTRASVANAIEKTGDLFARAGCEVKVMSWEGVKGADDLIAKFGPIAFDEAYNSALDFDYWKVSRFTHLTYPANIQINQRYLGQLAIPDSAKLVAIKAAKGTGKTEFLVGEVEKAHEAGKRVLVLTHRVQLGEALCNRFGIPYVTEVKDSDTGDVLGYGLCADSLHAQSQARFNPNDWHNAVVIIDEVEQVFWHMLNASTEVQKHRVKILKNFKILIQNVLSSKSGRVYIADADLCDIAINYIKSLAGFYVDPFVIVNDWQPSAGVAHIYPGSDPRELLVELEKHIEAGGRPFICCSAQKAKSKWGTKTLEYKLRKSFPNLRILRVDSETVADPTHAAYGVIAQLNQVLPQYDIVIASPSIETGVSIDIKGHFTSVWGIAQGVQPENSVRQALARLREPVDRHIWNSPVGLRYARIGNGATTPGGLLRGQHGQTKANITLLAASDCGEELQIDDNFQPESLWTWAKRASVINSGMTRYRDAIVEGLMADGYQIKYFAPEDDSSRELVDEVTAIRDMVYQKECEDIVACELPSDSELKAIKEKRAKTPQERYQERKAELVERYGEEVTPELVRADDDGCYPKLRLYYYMTVGNLFLPARDARRAKAQLEAGEGDIWKPDFNKGQLLPTVRLLENLNVLELLKLDRFWKGTDPFLQEMAATVKKHKQIIKNYLKLTVSDKDSPIAIAQKLLSKLGLKLTFMGKEGARGAQQRVYSFMGIEDGREDLMKRWLDRETVVTPGNKDINTLGVDTLPSAC